MDASLLSRINAEWLLNHYHGNISSLQKHFARFHETSHRALHGMQHASQLSDLVGWKFHAGAIKTAAQPITARRIISLCEEAESMLSLAPSDGMALIYHFEKELVILKRESEKLLVA